MSLLGRYAQTIPASRRAYSSFFSSKAGGGRYFNSAKPPKAIVVNRANTNPDGSPSAEPTDNTQGPVPSSTNITESSSSNNLQQPEPAVVELHTPQPHPESPLHSSQHSKVTAKDFKLHQFFALHRPLLLLSHPASILNSHPDTTPFLPGQQQQQQHTSSTLAEASQETPETSQEADAECSRQLSRALTMNHAGGAVDWDNTLRRLGLNVGEPSQRNQVQEEWNKEWTVVMDSVKRKRRKKMKKHQLRKRKRALRATRMQTKK